MIFPTHVMAPGIVTSFLSGPEETTEFDVSDLRCAPISQMRFLLFCIGPDVRLLLM
jgi:hypothetical protein